MAISTLTSDEIASYRQHGYIVPKARLSARNLETLAAAYERLGDQYPQLGLDFVPSPHVPNFAPGFTDCQPWLDFAAFPEILDVVESLVGGDFLMWGSAIFGKPSGDGKETPMHQDGEYWPIRPLASVTVWIAIDDSTPKNGCLRVVPGSHRAKKIFRHRRDDDTSLTLNQAITDSAVNLADAVDVTLQAGQFSVHDIFLVHGSRPNHSGHRRAGLTYRYMPTTSHFDHAMAGEMARTMGTTDMSSRPLYLMRGIDRCGKNDFNVGENARLSLSATGAC